MYMIILQIDNKKLRETYSGKYLTHAYKDIQQTMARWDFFLVKGTGCVFVGDNPSRRYDEEVCATVMVRLLQRYKWLAPALIEFGIYWVDAEDEQRLCVLEECTGLPHISLRGKLRTN